MHVMNNDTTNGAQPNDSCWNVIGVWGTNTARCTRLDEVTHCRNCDVFVAAGRDLLNREPPPGYLEEWTELLARKTNAQDSQYVSLVIFRIEKEWLALPSKLFKEVVAPRAIHRIPHRTNDVLLGLANIHGQLHVCFSLKAFIGIPDSAERDGITGTSARMLVAQKDGECWVFPVDEIAGVCRCGANDARNVPVTVAKAAGTYTRGILLHDQKEVGLLDDELLIYALKRSML